METKIVKSLGAMVLGLTAATAQAIPLTDLFAGDTIQSGDKLFSAWEQVEYLAPESGNPIDLSTIEVTALADDGSNNPGLRFDFAQPLTVSDLADETSLWFSYAVDVLDPSQQLIGTTLELTGFRAENDGGLADGFVEITGHEAGFDELNPDLEVYSDILEPIFFDEELFAEYAFGPTDSTVMDMLLIAVSFDGIFEISSFEQRFNQRVADPGIPAPATLALLLLGLAGIGIQNRRKPAASH